MTFGERTKIPQKILITKNYSSDYVLDRIIRLFLTFVNVKENPFTILRHQSVEHRWPEIAVNLTLVFSAYLASDDLRFLE